MTKPFSHAITVHVGDRYLSVMTAKKTMKKKNSVPPNHMSNLTSISLLAILCLNIVAGTNTLPTPKRGTPLSTVIFTNYTGFLFSIITVLDC